MKKLSLVVAALVLGVVTAPATAHAPHVGPKKGQTIHWGTHHFELVPGADAARLYIYAASNRQPVPVAGFTAKARILSGGKMTNLAFAPAGANVLAGKGAKLTGDWTALVSVAVPGRGTATIRYSAKDLATLRKATGHGHAG